MKQTAVEWLVEQLFKINNNTNDVKKMDSKSIIEQAKEMEEEQKGYSEEDLDSFGVTKTQFEVYRNFNKQETLEEAAESYAEPYKCTATNENKYCKHDILSAFNNGAKWQQKNLNKCYHPLTERKYTSDTHFECTICGYNNY